MTRKSRMTRAALDTIEAGSIPKGYSGPFSLETGQPITRVCLMSDAICHSGCTDRCARVPDAKKGQWQ